MIKAHFILYVKDQTTSAAFYTHVLSHGPSLNVPGMTEFMPSADCILGLMPQTGIKRLLGESLPDLSEGPGIPRAELYLLVDDVQAYHRRALEAGATELSKLSREVEDIMLPTVLTSMDMS